jgi:hypothetical protein
MNLKNNKKENNKIFLPIIKIKYKKYKSKKEVIKN